MHESRPFLRILIVDDHAIVREGVRRILEAMQQSWAVIEAESGFEALEALRQQVVDVAIVDLSMPGMSGLELTHRIRAEYPRTGVLMLSMHAEEQYAVRAFTSGANGYLTKDSAPRELVSAVEKIAAGRSYVTPEQAERVVARLSGGGRSDPHAMLSNREFDVLRRIVSGQRIKTIAAELHLSVKTVSTHKARLLAKLQLPSTAALIRYGLEQGLAAEPAPECPPP